MQKTIKRREFVKSLSISATAAIWGRTTGLGSSIDKREIITQLIAGSPHEWYVPAGFFVHFGDGYRWGDAAVKRHLEYFTAIDMDFIKVQYEQTFPPLPQIRHPDDWQNMPFYDKDFYQDQLYVVKELVKNGKALAPVIVTLYSPFMCAGHSTGSDLLTQHMKQDPESVKKGLEIITESVMIFAKECIKLGVDGFLASTQGGEGFRFNDPQIFKDYIKPFDLMVMHEINVNCNYNILHICDYEGDYNDLNPFLDYPGQIVNCSTKVGNGSLSPKELNSMFKRPFMGGLEKRGPITSGNIDQLEQTASEVLSKAPSQFIIGAECALLGDVDWKKVRKVVDMAHHS